MHQIWHSQKSLGYRRPRMAQFQAPFLLGRVPVLKLFLYSHGQQPPLPGSFQIFFPEMYENIRVQRDLLHSIYPERHILQLMDVIGYLPSSI